MDANEKDTALTQTEDSQVSTEASIASDLVNRARSITISPKAVVMGVVVVLTLFILSYVLTFVLDKGYYLRDAEGSIIAGTYTVDNTLDGIKWWQFLLAPIMILLPSTEGSMTVWAILLLLLIIGAIFNALDESGIMVYMVEFLNHKLGHRKYLLLVTMSFAFMFLGSSAGMLEELIPLVPVVIMLSYALGWDALVGLGISCLAASLGFSAAVINPFTVGVAQTIGGITMYSGIGLRILTFVVAYAILIGFLLPYAKKIEKYPHKSPVYALDSARKKEFSFRIDTFKVDKKNNRALIWFAGWMSGVILLALISIFWQALSSYLMYIILVIYLIAGIGACIICGEKGKALIKNLLRGMLTLLPAVVLILIAGGIRYVVEEGDVMDTILFHMVNLIGNKGDFTTTLIIYGLIFVFEIFIQSGSAKAFLLMPMVFDICSMVGINPQVSVLAFCFADGFANFFLPTNAGLLLILGLTTVDYGKWFKWSLKIYLTIFAATIGILAIAQYLVYA